MHIDIPTGRIIASTAGCYDRIKAGGFVGDGKLFYVQCPILGDYAGRNDLLVFSMQTERLAPQSIIRYGAMLSDDAAEVVIDVGTLMARRWKMPYLSLDELINRGRDLSEGFEFSEMEKEEYLL